jgi:AmmeMemoRadiSam system protein A
MNPYVSLTKSAVENYVKEGKVISPSPDLPEELLKKKAGVFVTIEKEKELRGCIGTYLPTKENIAKEIISNAIAAAVQDYRFGPIQKEELPHLSYTVYLLSEPEPIKNIKELNPKKCGIIVKTVASPQKSGLLLPDLEDVDTIEEQIAIACQKAGIDLTEEKILIYKFTVKKYKGNG